MFELLLGQPYIKDPVYLNGDYVTLANGPVGGNNVSSCYYNGKLFIYGGSVPPDPVTRNFYIYDTATDTWSQGASGPPHSRGSAMVGYNGYIWLYGGNAAITGGSYIDTVWRYDIIANTWTEMVTPVRPVGRGYMGYIRVKDILYICGGITPITNETWAYNLNTNTWTQLASFPVAGMYGIVAHVNNHLFLQHSASDDLYRYSIATNEWIVVKTMNFNANNGAMYSIGNKLYFFFGSNNNRIRELDLDTFEETILGELNQPLAGFGYGGYDNRFYIYSGYDNTTPRPLSLYRIT